MKVHTDISRFDLIHFNLVILPRLRSTYVMIGVITLAMFSYVLWENGSPETMQSWIILVIGSVMTGIVGILVGTIFSMVFILTSSSKSNGILGEHEYEITSEGLFEKTQANEALNKWSGIQEIRRVSSFLLFRISGYLFHIIPRRSFESNDVSQAFLEKAKSKWRGAA